MSRHGATWPRHICAIQTLVRRIIVSKKSSHCHRGPLAAGGSSSYGYFPRLQLATSEAHTDATLSAGLAQRKEKVIILTGATAVGKTKTSIELAQRIGGEIISADSVQVYKGLDVGSDKVQPRHSLTKVIECHPCMPPDLSVFCRSCLVRGMASLTTSSTSSLPIRSSLPGTSTAWLAQPPQTFYRYSPACTPRQVSAHCFKVQCTVAEGTLRITQW